MASNDLEVLDPVAPVESVKESKSGHELDRRDFFTVLGVAGIAAGAALLSKSADAQQPSQSGYAQIDIINFLLNIKYLKATLYSYGTQAADLPGSSYVTLGSGVIFNQPKAAVKFTGANAAQITDIFNEMYYDELNQLVALRALYPLAAPQQGSALSPRATMNLLGTGTTTTVNLVYDPTQFIALARLLEDLSATAFAAATPYLTGMNLQLATQALASDGLHAGIIRLITIQNGIQYQGTQYGSLSTSNTAQTNLAFSGATTVNTNLIYALLPTPPAGALAPPYANQPAVGNVLTGIGIPLGAGAVITSVNYVASATATAITTKSSAVLTLVTPSTTLVMGQPITGTNIPGNTYIVSLVPAGTITMSATASASTTVAPTGYVTAGSPTVTNVSSITGLIAGQVVTGTGIQANTTVTTFDGTANTITLSLAATVTPLTTTTGYLTNNTPKITNVASLSGFIVGQPITGTGIPNGTTILNFPDGATITLSANATATTAALANATTFTGFVTSGSKSITSVVITPPPVTNPPTAPSAGFVVGQQIAGPGIIPGTTIASFTSNSITLSANANVTSVITTTATTGYLSNTLTGAASTAGFNNGASISGTYIPAPATITGTTANTITFTGAISAANPTGAAISNETAAETVTTPAPATLHAGGQLISTPALSTLTVPTTETVTIGQSTITLAGNANLTAVNTFSIVLPDNQDVVPGDPGVNSSGNPISAGGPSAIAGTNPPLYQGFFNTAGAGSTSSTNTPPGFAFARTFQQVLAVLYGYNTTNSIISTQNFEGGFFPVGVSGPINSVI